MKVKPGEACVVQMLGMWMVEGQREMIKPELQAAA